MLMKLSDRVAIGQHVTKTEVLGTKNYLVTPHCFEDGRNNSLV